MNGSVTNLIEALKTGDDAATGELWARVIDDLVRVAKRRLNNAPCTVADEDDLAASVFLALQLGAVNGAFHRLHDRRDLWAILLMLTDRKVTDHRRYFGAKKRSDWKTIHEADIGNGNGDGDSARPPTIDDIAGKEASPEFVVAFEDEFQRLMEKLKDETFQRIALMKMAGHSLKDIAAELEVTPRTVQRKLTLIRDTWGEDLGDEEA